MELNTFKPWLVRPVIESFVRLAVLNVSVVAARKQPLGRCLNHQPQFNAKVAANLIAAKFEEIPSEVQVFVYITADVYTRDELIEMEV